MKRLYLFTVFHANFGFSSIPRSHYSGIIDRCLWPVLDLLGRHPDLRLGVEFPAQSLSLAAAEDPLLLANIRQHIETGQLELVGSGFVQSILPLIPEAANRHNLALGQGCYKALLGQSPVTAYANEQVVSSSLLELYCQSGFRAIVADWENAKAASDCSEAQRYRPLLLEMGRGEDFVVLWNSTVAFQKFQRYLHGEISLEDYWEFLSRQWSADEDRLFCLYGGDWELIDYRPGEIDFGYERDGRPGIEAERIETLVAALQEDERFEWILPHQAGEVITPMRGRTLSSAATPLPTKKQPRYNPTRWAVSGRASPTANAECFLLYRHLRRLEALQDSGFCPQSLYPDSIPSLWKELCYLWSSDFRTRTTSEKWLYFRRRVGYAIGTAEDLLSRIAPTLAEGHDLALFNPAAQAWSGRPFELRVRFAPGMIRGLPALSLEGERVLLQVEEAELYRDGSLRKALLVFCPKIPPGTRVLGRFEDCPPTARNGAEFSPWLVETGAVRLELNRRKGGTIKALSFPGIAKPHLAGTIPHGTLEPIELTPDWYSGGLIIIDQNGGKITDLSVAMVGSGPTDEQAPIRIPLVCRVETAAGPVWKTYYVYRTEPRLDLRYHMRFDDLRPKSFRLGILTVNPEAFDKHTLAYATVNGFSEVESFPLAGQVVAHDQAVSFEVSARGCVGATEGWIDVADREKGIAIVRDLSQVYTVPLVHYQETRDSYLLRIYLSAGESDDTSAVLWRGHLEVGFTFYGHRGDLSQVRNEAEARNLGLEVAWGRPDRARAG